MSVAVSEDLLDEQWLSAPQRRSRIRVTLVLLLSAAVVFLAGVLVQKTFGVSEQATSAENPFANGFPSGLPEGLEGIPTGMFPGNGQIPQAAEQPPGDEGESSSVIGTVVRKRGTTWLVEDLGGTRHRIIVSGDVTVTREIRSSSDDIATGDTVTVTGSSSGKAGTLTVTEVIIR